MDPIAGLHGDAPEDFEVRLAAWHALHVPATPRANGACARRVRQAGGLNDRQNLRATLFGESDSEEEAEPSGSAGKDALARLAARKRQERQEAVSGRCPRRCVPLRSLLGKRAS